MNDLDGTTSVNPLKKARLIAEELGVGQTMLYRLAKTGRIPHYRFGRSILFDVHEIRAWMREQAQARADSTKIIKQELRVLAGGTFE